MYFSILQDEKRLRLLLDERTKVTLQGIAARSSRFNDLIRATREIAKNRIKKVVDEKLKKTQSQILATRGQYFTDLVTYFQDRVNSFLTRILHGESIDYH